jgi:hypothetical protein
VCVCVCVRARACVRETSLLARSIHNSEPAKDACVYSGTHYAFPVLMICIGQNEYEMNNKANVAKQILGRGGVGVERPKGVQRPAAPGTGGVVSLRCHKNAHVL